MRFNRHSSILGPAVIAALIASSGIVVGCDDDGGGDILSNRDSGTDAGTTPTDVGTTPTDMGTTQTDVGTTPADTGTTPTDVGTNPTDTGTTEAGTTPTDSGTTPTDVGADSGVTCPASPMEVHITADTITANTTWDCTRTYILDGATPTFVMSPAVLTIGPGTVVRGSNPSSAIIITRGARLEANGTAEQPIVFTSNRPVGMRRAGDWGGVVMLGNARINDSANMTGSTGTNQLEGLDSTDMRGRYGGGATPDDAASCGTLRYARIEFAGYTLSANNELNSLTLCACGSGTTIDYVQVHRGADDGVEIFGGTTNIRHIVSTQSDDDGLDWDQGWRGKGQFIVVQGPAMSGESDPSGIEADNDRDVPTSMPTSEPTLYNLTVLGPGNTVSIANNRAVVLRRGTAGRLVNALVGGFPVSGIDVRDTATFTLAMGDTPRLQFANSLIWANGPDGMQNFLDNTTDTFDEAGWFTAAARNNRVGTDPMLPAPYNATAPGLVPPTGSAAATGAATPPSDGFFDATATFVGAVPPGSTTNWMSGWTAFPAN